MTQNSPRVFYSRGNDSRLMAISAAGLDVSFWPFLFICLFCLFCLFVYLVVVYLFIYFLIYFFSPIFSIRVWLRDSIISQCKTRNKRLSAQSQTALHKFSRAISRLCRITHSYSCLVNILSVPYSFWLILSPLVLRTIMIIKVMLSGLRWIYG